MITDRAIMRGTFTESMSNTGFGKSGLGTTDNFDGKKDNSKFNALQDIRQRI